MKKTIRNAGLTFILTGYFCVLLLSSALCEEATVSSSPGPIFRVLDIGERTYEGGPAIAILFSESLDPKIRHDDHIRISDSQGLIKSAWVLSQDCRILWFPFAEPETEYSVSVLETMISAGGHSLNGRVSQALTTRKIMPVVSFAGEGFLLPAKMTQGLPVITVNVPSVEMEFFRLNEKALVGFVDWRNLTGRKEQYDLSRIREYGELVFSGRFDLKPARNKRTVCHIPVEDIQALQNPGVYLTVMREPGEYNYSYQSTYFLITDIGLHARIYQNETLIIASSLKSGEPLFDVRLTFYDDQSRLIGEGFTDAEGCYRSPQKLPDNTAVIKAEYGNQTGILPMRIPGLDMSEFDLGKRPYKAREIYVFSPRDLYRPGETVIVSALLRDYDGRPVESLPVTAKLFRPDGQEAKTFVWNEELRAQGSGLGKNLHPEHRTPNTEPRTGYYQSELELSKDAQTGRWSLKLWDDPSANAPCAEFDFQVEEFLPERMKLDLGLSEPQPSGPADPLEISVSGEYLYGAPASGNEVRSRVRVRATREISGHFKGFQFGNIKDSTYNDYWELPSESLNAEGHLNLTIDSRWQDIQSPLSVKVIVSLFESGGRPVTRNIAQTILPAESLIGIRPLFDEKAADEGPLRFEVIRIMKDGTPAPLPQDLAPPVELIKEDRDYYWEYSESAGWQYRYSEKNYQFLTDTLKLNSEGPTPYTLHLDRGQYLLSVTDPETGLTTSIRFHVGYWWHGKDSQADAARPDRVILKPDKPEYQPGDIIRLTVLPPHDGEGVIMVEGESLLWSKRMKVSAKGTLAEIPVSARWKTHNLYIGAVVFRPADAKEKITPNRAAGLIHLPLKRSDRKLDLMIHAPEKAASQGPLTVKLKANSSRPAGGASLRCTDKQSISSLPAAEEVFVTLAATDVGILNITDFQTPDPFAYFFQPRRYTAEAYDIYGKVIESTEGHPAALRYGGDADAGGKRPESEVKPVSLFHGPCAFDKNGEAEIKFDLPDFNGRLRLMAVAFDKDCFGSAETEVTVAAPTVTQLSMPRFLAPGDESELTLDVHNLSGTDQHFSLSMTATDPLILEKGRQNFQLAEGKKTTLRFPVKVGNRHAASEIHLHLESADIALDREWKLGVRPGYPAIARKVRNVLNENKNFALDPAIAADMIPETVRADMKISPVIPLDIRNAMQDLILYPYGCLEQTTSQAYPLIFATPDRIAKYNLPPISHEERFRRLEKAVERLSSMQLVSGGFGLWDKNSPEAPWLTVYATEFLLAARDTGIKIPNDMDNKALERLNQYLQQGPSSLPEYGSHRDTEHLDFAVRSYAGYVLSKVNYAELGTLRILFDNHIKRAGSSLPLTHLGIALQITGDSRRSQEALKEAAQKRCDRFGYWGDYGSLIRDLAMSIALFIENNAAETEGFEKLILDLEQELYRRRWLSTQEKFAVFKAGTAMEAQGGKPWKGRLNIAGKESREERKGAYITSLMPEDIARGIAFVSETPDILYVSAIVNGYTKSPPPKDESRISIQREIYDAEGKTIRRSEFKTGELVLVHLRLISDEWVPDALAVDLLPAGFELENQNLKHSVGIADIQIAGASVWRLKEEMNISHEEYRDDRYAAVLELDKDRISHLFYLMRAVTPGTFSVPPTFVESMYRPEIRGIGDSPGAVRVVP